MISWVVLVIWFAYMLTELQENIKLYSTFFGTQVEVGEFLARQHP